MPDREGCDASALLGHPERTPGVSLMIVHCAKPGDHGGPHKSDGMLMNGREMPTSVTWYEDDRRTFRGELTLCDESTCILPAGHRGSHAA